jgi:hypothetical protein
MIEGMSRTTKSTLSLARTALDAAERVLPDYSCPKSPRRYTQPQLLAILCVKEFEGLDYRGVAVRLAEWRELRQALRPSAGHVPDPSTLCKAAARLLGEKDGAVLAGRVAAAVA